MNCNNCETEITLKYCPNCGKPATLKRIDGKYILHEIEHVLHVERGIFFTIKELFLRPGKGIHEYLTENRNRLIKPIIFVIISSLIYSVINNFFHVEDQYLQTQGLENTFTGKILGWMQANYGYMNILMSVFIAFFLKIFFKKEGYNFYELLIVLCFVSGISMLIFALFGLIEGLTHLKLMMYTGILSIAYLVWAIAQFFNKKNIGTYFKIIAAYFLGSILFFVLLFGIGILLEIIKK